METEPRIKSFQQCSPKTLRVVLLALMAIFLPHCLSGESGFSLKAPEDPAEVAIGERLFLETRFAQFFAAKSPNSMNGELLLGDPVMNFTATIAEPFPGPFQGQSMNCASCHLVDQHLSTPGGGMRTYNDFARRSPIPAREDGKSLTPRNSPPLVNSMVAPNELLFLHFDGEFATIEDLVRGTFTGRNFGWKADEKDQAIHHIAQVIREDDGRGGLAGEFEFIPYRTLLMGADPDMPQELLLPEEFRIDVDTASDEEILNAVAKLTGAYVRNLLFAQNEAGEFIGSAYDLFLEKNNLPRKPDPGESDLDYSRRLLDLIHGLSDPIFVGPEDGALQFHFQDFAFGSEELEGLKIFLSEPQTLPLTQPQIDAGGVGNCLACHAPPNFSDFGFHNTGVAQAEFDSIHGDGEFTALFIPDYFERNANRETYLPPSGDFPNALGMFLDIPSLDKPGHTDLGLWNVLGNPAVPDPQEKLLSVLCEALGDVAPSCEPQDLLPFAIGLFKTPGLRDLGHSGPYMHTGQMDTLMDVLEHYRVFSQKTRDGTVRNPPKQFLGMALTPQDLPALVAFLKSLNEDYQ